MHDELVAIKGYVDGIETTLTSIDGKDFATQTTLAALNTKIPSDPSKESGKLTEIDTVLDNIYARLDIALSTLRDAITAASPNNKTLKDLYDELVAIKGYVDGVETTLTSIETLLGGGLPAALDSLLGLKVNEQLPTALVGGTKTVAAAATPEALCSSTTIKNSIIVQALEANTGYVKIGDSSDQYVQLEPLDACVCRVSDIANIYIEVEVNGEGVVYFGG